MPPGQSSSVVELREVSCREGVFTPGIHSPAGKDPRWDRSGTGRAQALAVYTARRCLVTARPKTPMISITIVSGSGTFTSKVMKTL